MDHHVLKVRKPFEALKEALKDCLGLLGFILVIGAIVSVCWLITP